MRDEPTGADPRPVGSPSGLSPEERGRFVKAAIFVAAAPGPVVTLKLCLGY